MADIEYLMKMWEKERLGIDEREMVFEKILTAAIAERKKETLERLLNEKRLLSADQKDRIFQARVKLASDEKSLQNINKYIDLNELPDDFYHDLINSINECYSSGIYLAVPILNRKLLENLLIDLLRKKFGMTEIDLFFDTNKRRFHGFNLLIENMKKRLNDFKPISAAFDSELISKINKFRELGNSSAHTIEVQIKKEELDKDRDDLVFVVKVLSKAIKSF